MKIRLEVSQNFTVAHTIRIVIEMLNKQIDGDSKNYNKISMHDLAQLNLAIAKKNGDKKNDLPSKRIKI